MSRQSLLGNLFPSLDNVSHEEEEDDRDLTRKALLVFIRRCNIQNFSQLQEWIEEEREGLVAEAFVMGEHRSSINAKTLRSNSNHNHTGSRRTSQMLMQSQDLDDYGAHDSDEENEEESITFDDNTRLHEAVELGQTGTTFFTPQEDNGTTFFMFTTPRSDVPSGSMRLMSPTLPKDDGTASLVVTNVEDAGNEENGGVPTLSPPDGSLTSRRGTVVSVSSPLMSPKQSWSQNNKKERKMSTDETSRLALLKRFFNHEAKKKASSAHVVVTTTSAETPEQREHATWIQWRESFTPLWETIHFHVMLYCYVTVLFRCCFEVPSPLGFVCFDLILDIFLAGVVVMGFYIPDLTNDLVDTLITKEATRMKYIGSYKLWLDIISCLPYDLIGLGIAWYDPSHAPQTYFCHRSGMLVPYFRIPKLIAVYRFDGVCRVTLSRAFAHFNPVVWRITHAFVIFLMAVHAASCLWFFMLLYLGPKDGFESWAGDRSLFNATVALQYTSAVDFTTKNMVGMSRGSGFPPIDLALGFMLVLSMVGVSLYSTLIATIGNLISNQETASAKYSAKVDEVLDALSYRQLPREFVASVMEYYRHVHVTSSTLITLRSEFLVDLPRQLRQKMALVVGTSILQRVPIFQIAMRNNDFVIQIASKLRAVVYPPYTAVITAGDIGDAMYFVLIGILKVMNSDGVYIATLRKGDFFGEIAILIGCQRTATVYTCTYTNCMELRRDDFNVVAERFPHCLTSVRDRAQERLAIIYADIERKVMYYDVFMVGSSYCTIRRCFRYWFQYMTQRGYKRSGTASTFSSDFSFSSSRDVNLNNIVISKAKVRKKLKMLNSHIAEDDVTNLVEDQDHRKEQGSPITDDDGGVVGSFRIQPRSKRENDPPRNNRNQKSVPEQTSVLPFESNES
eukprot:PhF_6_TR946/c0_g1_i5/m.1730/K04949/CNGA2; cyclic nucleotide gated channel alpha 2